MKMIFDLDGTLICSKKRLYELFCFLAGDYRLSFSTYWDLKFSGQTNQQILINSYGFSNIKVQNFVDDWMSLIESDQYLKLDSIIEGVPGFLSELKKSHNIYLCTARQSIMKVTEQLQQFSIADHFEKIFVTEQSFSKEQLLRDSGLSFDREDWIIGDTGHDILTGKALGLKTCAVLSGFMCEETLIKYNPDIVLSDVSGFKDWHLHV